MLWVGYVSNCDIDLIVPNDQLLSFYASVATHCMVECDMLHVQACEGLSHLWYIIY